ncbi:MAG: beta-galactosidase trimerization domain-containing protein, partial [Armatimonadetes bacterium]|nr:beta-galactosidase trimerization domain-containing protein [Candidatus Hippobium faecium]
MHFDLHVGLEEKGLAAEITHENLKEALLIINPDWIQCDCKGHPGITGWPTEYGTMSHGAVKDPMRIHADVCHELGIKLGMHYSGVIDNQACTLHPEWEAQAPANEVLAQGYDSGMKSICPHSAYYDELMIPQMLELIDKYDVDGFWVDGDCWGVKLCYCDKCCEGFIKKYGVQVPTDRDCPEWRLWTDYHRELFVENVNKYTDAVHKRKPDCLIISNWMLTFGAPVEDNLSMDYISGDLSHNWGLKSAMLEGHFIPNRKRDWDLMVWAFESTDFGHWTEKSVPHLTQECAYIVACGGAAMIYETPHRNGLFTKWHLEDYRKIREFLKPRAEVSRHSLSVPQVAVIHNPDDYFDATKEVAYCISLMHPSMRKFTGCASLLAENHYHFDFLMPSMIKGRMDDFKTVVIPDVYMFDDEFVSEVKDYVKAGGNVIISGANCAKTFGELLGVKEEGFESNHVYVQSENQVTVCGSGYEKVSLTDAQVFRYVMNNQIIGMDETNNPAITVNTYGKGKAVGIYFNMFDSHGETHYPRNRRLFREIMDLLDCEYMVSDVQAPFYVHINVREKEDRYIINLINTGKVTTATELPVTDMVEEVPCVPCISFKVKVPQPKYAELVPGQVNLYTEYKVGYLYVQVRNLNIEITVFIFCIE